MTKIKHPHLIADIEPNIALSNALTVEREYSISIAEPDAHSSHRAARAAHHGARRARAVYIRQLFVRAFTVLTTGGLDDAVAAHSSHLRGSSVKSGPK